MELFVFAKTLVFDSVLYKGTSKSPLLFELLSFLHPVQMKVELILKIVQIARTIMVEAGIDGLSRGNNLGEGDDSSGAFAIFRVGKRVY